MLFWSFLIGEGLIKALIIITAHSNLLLPILSAIITITTTTTGTTTIIIITITINIYLNLFFFPLTATKYFPL